MRYYAIEILLEGRLKDDALHAVSKVKRNVPLSKPIKCIDPHICLSAGTCSDETRLVYEFEELLQALSPFELKSNGLGVFICKAPVIYIRWVRNKELMEVFRKVYGKIQPLWKETYPNYQQELWEPKTTLFLNEVEYSSLPQVIEEIKDIDFRQMMTVNSIALDRIDSDNIQTLKSICLQ